MIQGILNPDTRACPTCARSDASETVFDERIDSGRLDSFAFASRKVPEFFSLRMVRCPGCDTVYAPSPPHEDALQVAYRDAAFDTGPEGDAAASTYAFYMAPHLPSGRRNGALEIGAGTGAFLPYLSRLGYEPVIGIEPSIAAVEAASGAVRDKIRVKPFFVTDFAPESFDLLCCFQTLEHLADPLGFLREAWTLLRPGGLFCAVTHDHRAWTNRLLGRKSPIVDIEHLQLFSRQALEKLLIASGFTVQAIHPIANAYPLRYWLRLSPTPRGIKTRMIEAADRIGLGRLLVKLPVGNLMSVGCKPNKRIS